MTETELNEMKQFIEMYPQGSHAIFVENRMEGAWTLSGERLKELIRLARVGLQLESGEIKCSHGPYKHFGTDGCRHCDDGRINLYYLDDRCLECQIAQETT